MSIDPSQLRQLVIRPTLKRLASATRIPWTPVAESLLMATAAQESACGRFVAQLGGPALGLYQMEPETAEDVWRRGPAGFQPALRGLIAPSIGVDPAWPELVWNLALATMMARVKYWLAPQPLPGGETPQALWPFYKSVWNTAAGAATEAQFLDACARLTDLAPARGGPQV